MIRANKNERKRERENEWGKKTAETREKEKPI
jgi:hypothetical protein